MKRNLALARIPVKENMNPAQPGSGVMEQKFPGGHARAIALYVDGDPFRGTCTSNPGVTPIVDMTGRLLRITRPLPVEHGDRRNARHRPRHI
ncbi:MAG: hypothetical protein ABI682_15715 [Acidobacteriota bacterium]